MEKYAQNNGCKVYVGKAIYLYDRNAILQLHKQDNVFFPLNNFSIEHYLTLMCLKRKSFAFENEIRVFGKGAKERIVLISDRAKQYLIQYIKTARNLLAPNYDIGVVNDESPLFINNTGYRLQNKTIRKSIYCKVELLTIKMNIIL